MFACSWVLRAPPERGKCSNICKMPTFGDSHLRDLSYTALHSSHPSELVSDWTACHQPTTETWIIDSGVRVEKCFNFLTWPARKRQHGKRLPGWWNVWLINLAIVCCDSDRAILWRGANASPKEAVFYENRRRNWRWYLILMRQHQI